MPTPKNADRAALHNATLDAAGLHSGGGGTGGSASGSILTAHLGSGGTGYAIGDELQVGSSSLPTNARLLVDTIGGGGVILTYHFITTGSGHTVGTSPTFTMGTGSGATIVIDSVSGGSGSGGGSGTALTAVLGSDVAVGTSTWTDVLSLSVPAGTYVFHAMMSALNASVTAGWIARITDGTTHYASAEQDQANAGYMNSAGLVSGQVVLAATTTIKLQMFSSSVAGATAKAATGGTTGSIATRLTAMPVGGGGSALTVEEVDGSPTGTPSKLVFPNGSLVIASGVATYTPGGSGAIVVSRGYLGGLKSGTLDRAYAFDTTVEGWTTTAGTLSSTGGKLRLVHTAPAHAFDPGANLASGEFECDVNLVANTGSIGILFRYTDATHYYAWIFQTGFSFGLYMANGGAPALVANGNLGGVPVGASFHFLCRFVGSTLEAYLNGALIGYIINATLTTGKVGIRADNATVDIDNAKVYNTPVTTGNVVVDVAGTAGPSLTVEEADGTPTSTISKLVFPNGTLAVAGGVGTYTPLGLYPLDNLPLDPTYGDHFLAGALDAKWTRRNFVGSNEAFQTPSATWMRLNMTGRAAGDGYFQSVSGDWTFMMKCVARSATMPFWVIAAIDSAGTGIGTFAAASPNGIGLGTITTYTTYGGTFTLQGGVTIAQSVGVKLWQYLRKSGTNYYHAYSFDGEVWSSEVTLTSSATINRIGMMIHPYPWSQGGGTTSSTVDVDLFNKIA